MDVAHLDALRALRDRGTVTAAAQALHLTPSAVSQQLKLLGRQAGAPLTVKHGRGLRLTPAGLALAAAGDEVAVALARAGTAAVDHQSQPRGVVTVTAFQSGAQMLLPGLLGRVAAMPGVRIEVGDDDVAQDAFADLTLDWDVVIAHRPEVGSPWPTSVRVQPLLREPLDVALPPGHRLADRDEVRPADLVDEPWIAVRQGFPVAGVLDRIGLEAGAEPRVVHRINDFHVVAALVAAGHGVSLLPRYSTEPDRVGLRLVPLVGVRAARLVDALLRPERAARAVVAQVLAALTDEAAAVVARSR